MLTTYRVAGGALALLALFVLVESRKLPLGSLRAPGPAYMPVGLALILLVFGIALLAMGRQAPLVASVGWREWRHAAAIIGTCAFSALALERLGYRLTMTVCVILLVGLVERKGVVITLAFALALAFGSFLLFDTLLRVPLPRGPLGL